MVAKKSMHTTLTGYETDCTKYNLCQIEGWKVLRYTVLNHKNFDNDIKNILLKR